jgi:hypothetical protein
MIIRSVQAGDGVKKYFVCIGVLLGYFAAFGAEAAIAVRGTATAYYQSATVFSSGTPSVVGTGAAVFAASGNVTPPLPAGIVAGNLLLCLVESHDNVAPTFPAGWARLYRNRPGTEYSTAWYKFAAAAETNPLVTHAAGGSIIAQCAAYSNTTTAAPLVAGVAGTGAGILSGALTTTVANEMLLMAAHLNQGATTTSGWSMSAPGGLTWTQQLASTTTLGVGTPVAGSSIGLFSAIKATAGAQAGVTALVAGTVNAASLNYGVLIDLKPGLAINKPAGTVAGDLMVLSIAARSDTAVITPPAGWTLLLTTTNATNTRSKLSTYYKIAGASEPTSYAWSSGAIEAVASLVSFSGVDATTPFDGVAPLGLANTAATTTQTAPSITPASANDWLVTVHELTSTPCSAAFTNGWTPPTGMTERTDICSRAAASANGMGMEVATLGLTTAVATGTKIATAAANAARGISQAMVLRPVVVPAPHHIRIEHNGGACSGSGAPAQITLKVCLNAACTAPYYTAADVTGINLAPTTAGYTWSPLNPQAVLAASGGINSAITLASSAIGTAVLAITGTPSPAPANTYECYNANTGVVGDCNLAFTDNALVFDVPNHTSGMPQTVSVSSCKGAFVNKTRSVKFWSTYVNPASGTAGANTQQAKVVAGAGNADCTTGYSALSTSSATPAALSLAFGSGIMPQATFTLCYPDVGQMRVDARYDGSAATGDNGTVILGNDGFIAKPDHFTVSAIKCTTANAASCAAGALPTGDNPAAVDATGASFIGAGDSTSAATRFSATITAKNALNATASNFGLETPPEGIKLASILVSPVGGAPGVLSCKGSSTACVVSGGAANFSMGATTVTDLAWDEVGIIQLMPTIGDADYLGMGEVTAPTASGNVGRFIPNHFDTVITEVTPAAGGAEAVCTDNFTYSSQPFIVQVSAHNSGGTVTQNYDTTAGYSNAVKLSDGNAFAGGALNNPDMADTLFVAGVGNTANPTDATSPRYVFTTAQTAPATIKLRAIENPGDGVSSLAGTEDTMEIRSGRMVLGNAHGSELLGLPISISTQFWATGGYYTVNTADNCTMIPASSIALAFNAGTPSLVACDTQLAPNGDMTFLNGILPSLRLSAPGANKSGSVNLSVNTGVVAAGNTCVGAVQSAATAARVPWLTSNTARATFGVYKGSNEFIYLRESY